MLLLDGCYTPDALFHPFHPPDEAHLASLCETSCARILKMLKRRGRDRDEARRYLDGVGLYSKLPGAKKQPT